MKNLGSILTVLFSILILTTSGCISDPAPSYEITWLDNPPLDNKTIEELITQQISPYEGQEYKEVTASSSGDGDDMSIHVAAFCDGIESPDLYDFKYKGGELIRIGYLLEAVPESIRDDAINIAMQEDISQSLELSDNPSVKRILPETAERFYSYKTLISVTWMESSVSVLVDIETGEVAQVWHG